VVDQRLTAPPTAAPGLVEFVMMTQRRLSRGLSAVLAEESFTVEQWRIMSALADGEGHLMGELAESRLIPHPTLTRIVEGLVDDGLVYRRISKADRRRVAVYLSRRGQERVVRLNARVSAQERALEADPEWAEIAALLRRLGAIE